jgi:hypothetical protein
MHRGFVKDYRKGISNPLFSKPLIWHFWTYCRLRANFKDTVIDFNGKPFEVKRGSFIMSLKTASNETGLTAQNIRTAIKILVSHKMIEKSTKELTKQATVITVLNYDVYQQQEEETNKASNKVLTKCQQSPNKVLTIDNNVKNDKNEEEVITTPKKTRKRKPKTDPPSPEEIQNFVNSISESTKNLCKEKGIGQLRFKQFAETCFDHFRSKPEQKADWEATVRNWIRNDEKFNRNLKTTSDDGRAKARELEEQTKQYL